MHIGKAGRIIEEIQARGFHVFGIQSFILTKKESEDFYEIYKGIEARDYFGLVRQGNIFLCSHFRVHIFWEGHKIWRPIVKFSVQEYKTRYYLCT